MKNMIIVLVAHGKGDSAPHNMVVKLFDEVDKATDYCTKVTDKTSKYWTVAAVVDESCAIEPSREGFYDSFSNDWY